MSEIFHPGSGSGSGSGSVVLYKACFFLSFFELVGKLLMLFIIGQFVCPQVNTGAYVDSAQGY